MQQDVQKKKERKKKEQHTQTKMWDVVQLKTEPRAAFYQYVGSAVVKEEV